MAMQVFPMASRTKGGEFCGMAVNAAAAKFFFQKQLDRAQQDYRTRRLCVIGAKLVVVRWRNGGREFAWVPVHAQLLN